MSAVGKTLLSKCFNFRYLTLFSAPLKFEHATVAVGRNPMLALGAHGSMASGANRALRSGPNKDLLVGSSGARGPDPSLRIMRN